MWERIEFSKQHHIHTHPPQETGAKSNVDSKKQLSPQAILWQLKNPQTSKEELTLKQNKKLKL
jgi:hypothetical protein